MLQLAFLDVGLTCPKAICNACCDVLMLLPTAMGGLIPFTDRTGVHIAHDGYESLLGPYPNERMYQICQTVWRTDPGYLSSATSLTDAYTTIQSAMTEATTMVRCSCQVHERCQTSLGWKESRNIAKRTCKVHRLWTAIGSALHYGFACFFVNAGCNATITHPTIEIGWRSIAHFITDKLKESSSARCGDCGDLRKMVMSLIEPIESVAASSNSSTLYPTALCTLALPREMNGQYSLVEGRLIHNGQYHNSMRHNTVVARPLAKKALLSHKSSIAPSCGGEHSDFMITVRECIGYLEMRTTARVGGSTVHLNLDATIISSWGLEETRPCGHSSATPLDSDDCKGVITTSVASPIASGEKIAIAQVQGNPVAQLLCCNPGTRSLIQTDCCLYCALEQAEGQFG